MAIFTRRGVKRQRVLRPQTPTGRHTRSHVARRHGDVSRTRSPKRAPTRNPRKSFRSRLLKAAAQRGVAAGGGGGVSSRSTTPGAGRSASVLSHVTERTDTRLVIRDEFIMNVDKFHRHVKRTIDRVKGEVRLEILTSSIGHDVKTTSIS